jgi:1-acyl-sn-glycerol-3-phosphate acyltransferase
MAGGPRVRADGGFALKRAYDYLITYGLLAILAIIILAWTVMALLLLPLPRARRRRLTRITMMWSFRLFTATLTASGAYELDLGALDALRGEAPLILAPNHPTSIDAVLFLSRHPDLACVLKPELMRNFFLGAGARLAGFIRSDPPRRMLRQAIEELGRGSSLLLFPEGTRTTRAPLNPLTASVGVIARRAQVPIQIAIIETDSPYLGKGYSMFKAPRLPIRCRVRLGRRLEPTEDAGGCTLALHRELTRELAQAPQNRWLAGRHGARSQAFLSR